MSTSLLAALRNVEADRDAIAAERDALRGELAALREMLATAWRAGRDAAVRECDKEAQICAAEGNTRGASEAFVLSNLIRVLEPPA